MIKAIGRYIFVLLTCLNFCVCDLSNWPWLSFQESVAVRGQRDTSKNIPIDQLTTLGVSLSSQLFDKKGYINDTLSDIETLLNVGVQTLVVDIYWNEFIGVWQLCPAPLPKNQTQHLNEKHKLTWEGKTYTCQPTFTFNNLVGTINSYLSASNLNLDLNLIQILLNLHSIHYKEDIKAKVNSSSVISLKEGYTLPTSISSQLGNSTLSQDFLTFGSLTFTANNLKSFQERYNTLLSFFNQSSIMFPSLQHFLFFEYQRIFVGINSNNLVNSSATYNFTTLDNNTFFSSERYFEPLPQTTFNRTLWDDCQNVLANFHNNENHIDYYNNLYLNTHFRFVSDDDRYPFTNKSIQDYVACGYSPILNASKYTDVYEHKDSTSLGRIVNHFLPLSFWSWAANEPTHMESSGVNDENTGNRAAFRCVAMTKDGFEVKNCYDSHSYACQKYNEPNNWRIETKKLQYFEAFNSCLEGYSLGVPLLSVESLSLRNTMIRMNISRPIWVDMNDITVPGCFVTGGPYMECPYQKTVSKLKLVRLIAPGFVVSVVLLFLIFLERFIRKNPIQSNRKRHWKKVINEYYKDNDYEGVPS
ncbi:uncharacterized protein PRCAT00005369001 [Priceomyces carsonii]|uniref:uncharacterized protein n=1 Tax=Priceomyces carsonii TaxID=28549 RepID=UPI002ED8C68E|nr:unnamed protein product [Priceomyces carsonii]